MSYVVTIKRRPPISADDWARAVAADASLISATANPGPTARWQDPTSDLELILTREPDGSVWATPRNEMQLAKMRQLAAVLSARLIGEQGEDLSSTAATASSGAGCGSATAAVLVIGLILATAIAFA
jgi:hypothetical protein